MSTAFRTMPFVVGVKGEKMDKVNEAYWRGYHNGYACAMEDNAELTIIRCKDCKYYRDVWCYKISSLDNFRGKEHYCAFGERREDADND